MWDMKQEEESLSLNWGLLSNSTFHTDLKLNEGEKVPSWLREFKFEFGRGLVKPFPTTKSGSLTVG